MKILNVLKKNKLPVIIVIAIVAWFGGSKLFSGDKEKVQYQSVQTQRKSLISSISVSGNVSSGGQVAVYSSISGIVEKIYVKNGDAVSVGEELFTVRSTSSSEEQASAYANYQSAISSTKAAKQNKRSLEVLILQKKQAVRDAQNNVDYKNKNTINPVTKLAYTYYEKQTIDAALVQAKKDLAVTETKYKEASIDIEAAIAREKSSHLAYHAIKNATVTSPVSGTVANLSITVGDNVSSGGASSGGSGGSSGLSSGSGALSGQGSSSAAASSAGSPALYVGNFSSLAIKASVNEIDLPKIKIGQKATITLDAFTDKTYAGEVTRIDKIGVVSSGVVTYSVYVSFASPPDDIAPGMTSTANIQIDRRDNVLSVPSGAVKKSGDQSVVRVKNKDGSVRELVVQTGLVSDSETEIASGLQDGQEVVTGSDSNVQQTQGGQSPFGGGFRPGGLGGMSGGRR